MENLQAHYLCPITNEIMEEPVLAADGHTYEKEAIQDWLVRHHTSPVTNAHLPNKDLIPNHTLKSWIIAHQESLRRAQKCFLTFEGLETKQQETLRTKSRAPGIPGKILQLILGAPKSKLEEIKKEWDRRNDMEKLKWLEELGLKEESYLYIKVEFKQFLSDITQKQRHYMKDRSGKHPSTEEFWKLTPALHAEWVKQMNQKSG